MVREAKKQRLGKIRGTVLILFMTSMLLMGSLYLLSGMLDSASRSSFPLPYGFIGEYRQGDEEDWTPMTPETSFDSFGGDLYLRGQFYNPMTESYGLDLESLRIYVNHIQYSLSINGTEYRKISQDAETTCGKYWDSVAISGVNLTPEDVVELHLHNPHHFGNGNAYNECLQHFFMIDDVFFHQYLLNPGYLYSLGLGEMKALIPSPYLLISGPLWTGIGYVVLIFCVFMIGIAFIDLLQGPLMGGRHWAISILGFFFSGLFLYGRENVNYRTESVYLNSNATQICRMMIVFFLLINLLICANGARKKMALSLIFLDACMNLVFTGLALLGVRTLCDTMELWASVSGFLLLAALVTAGLELVHHRGIHLFLTILFQAAALIDIVNSFWGWWTSGLFLRGVFLLGFLGYVIWTAVNLVRIYHGARRIRQVEGELAQSRITIALSQIQPHFLYNSLTAIRYLCLVDPLTAQKALDDFSSYLRANLDSLKKSTLVPFQKEREHVETYLSLEKLRFDEDLQVEWEVKTTDFTLPALTVQPIVENAVKYGVGKKIGGGTVTIRVGETEAFYEIMVEDDGVGFDSEAPVSTDREHTGIENVRSRLAAMCKGTLEIQSKPGAGTRAVIRIPKERN